MSSIDFSEALDCLKKAQSVLISCHVRPDGDSLGSAAGMAQMLAGQGKSAEIILPSELPDRYAFLFEQEQPRVIEDDWRRAQLAGFDTVVIVDTSVRAQLEPQFEFLKSCNLPVLVIDHHLESENIGTVELLDRSASAVGLMVAELAEAWPVELSAAAAKALFTAIASDTGWFRFPNADSRTYHQAWRLLQAGVRPTEVYSSLYMRASVAKVRLMGRALDSLELFCEGRLACMSLLKEDFRQTQAVHAETEGLINESLRIGSVIAAVMLTEDENGSIRVNFRSKRQINVARIAERFGGGGHKL
ncbi:MAG: bifunctional oligoribonuclease/PAP phosphatase NrnA, partial [Phycisphaerae bacterium]|nr:bifunctional oligoribonuclease/PAP phosphatase NrnA [Phycisphaerae bacterium]